MTLIFPQTGSVHKTPPRPSPANKLSCLFPDEHQDLTFILQPTKLPHFLETHIRIANAVILYDPLLE